MTRPERRRILPAAADWGLAIADSYTLISAGYWWIVTFDALAIISLIVAANLIAEGVSRAAGVAR